MLRISTLTEAQRAQMGLRMGGRSTARTTYGRGVKIMRRSHGTRQGTRSILRRSKTQRGRINIARVMHQYEIGDRVSVVLDGSQQKGMPHRRFHGKTGFIQKKQGRAWVVSVKDGNMQKTVVARPEHLRPLE